MEPLRRSQRDPFAAQRMRRRRAIARAIIYVPAFALMGSIPGFFWQQRSEMFDFGPFWATYAGMAAGIVVAIAWIKKLAEEE